MGKQLVITEKPSAARDIARALGIKGAGAALENDRYVVVPALGHLLEIADPADAAPPAAKAKAGKAAKKDPAARKPGKWTLAALPVVPDRFGLKVIKASEERLKDIGRALRGKDIDGVINACDAGREGELIFHNIRRHFGFKQPVRRLWLQSMIPKAIREGFENLLPEERMRPLQAAAVSRDESDWLVGINSTRALTALNSPKGSFNLTTVGRVQTPTLSLIVERERQIREFVPRDYWEVGAAFAAKAGTYEGKWIDPAHKSGGEADRPTWIMSAERAEEIAARVAGRPGAAAEERKARRELPPLLFDLTSLQRAANQRFGFSARSTLAIAQDLYMKQAITYPRTDSRRLPEDYPETVRETLKELAAGPLSDCGALIERALAQGCVRPGDRRIFDNSKVSDHFAIIPTGMSPTGGKEQNLKLYRLIATHFAAAFFPAAQVELIVRHTVVEGETFESRGRVVIDPGWLAVTSADGKNAARGEGRETLVPIEDGERVVAESAGSEAKQTQPPKRYNEASLLSAMEDAGKLVEDEELRESLKERGLGTPATRAATIEGLLREKYISRAGRELVPSQKAFSLMQMLSALKIDVLTRPDLTGKWEHKLKQIENASYSAEEFRSEIRDLTRQIVDATKRFDMDEMDSRETAPTDVTCPACTKGEMRSGLRSFRCDACGHAILKVRSGHELSVAELAELVDKGRIGPFDDFFSVRTRRTFSAALVLNGQHIPELELQPLTAVSAEEIGAGRQLGQCPACGQGQVVELPAVYMCRRAAGESPKCKFKVSRTILQREIVPEDMQTLIAAGATGVLVGFVSKRTHRRFSAKLRLEKRDDGEMGLAFEFDNGAKRKPAGKRKPAAKKPKPAAKGGTRTKSVA